MTQNLLSVVAEMVARPGKEDELKQHLLALVAPTLKEEGCVQYDLHQCTSEPGRFVFYENWTSREMLDRHAKSEHIAAFRRVRDEILAEPGRVLTYTRIA
ncbi:MAG: putative quinol monooxygenase [Bryobacteraceae bacterium]